MSDIEAILAFVFFTIIALVFGIVNEKNKIKKSDQIKRQKDITKSAMKLGTIKVEFQNQEKSIVDTPPKNKMKKESDLKESLSAKAIPLILPSKFGDLYAPETDAWDMPQGEFEWSTPFDKSILFKYMDGNGKESKRIVKCKEMQNYFGAQLAIYGQCQLRRAGRTFRIDRMSEVVDIETGEIIENLPIYVDLLWKKSAVYAFRGWCEANTLVIKTFLYFLCANKNPSKGEDEYARIKLMKISEIYNLGNDDWRAIYSLKFPETATSFQRHVGSVLRDSSIDAGLHLEIAQELTYIRKNPNFADLAALEYLKNKINFKSKI